MTNKIVSDSFETLGGGAKAVAGQVKQVVKGIGDDALESIGIKPASANAPAAELGEKGNQPQEDPVKRMEAKQKSAARRRYHEIQEEIKQLQVKRGQEMVKYNQPGFTPEEKQQNQIKQLEEKPSFAKATAGGKELPPLPAQRAQRKTEMLRGVSG